MVMGMQVPLLAHPLAVSNQGEKWMLMERV